MDQEAGSTSIPSVDASSPGSNRNGGSDTAYSSAPTSIDTNILHDGDLQVVEVPVNEQKNPEHNNEISYSTGEHGDSIPYPNSDQNVQDENRPFYLPDTSGYCLICGDKGSGYHYSVYSCEGCKGFFKRSVQKNLQYICKEKRECMINKFTRNSCQYCRFQRCMEVGMKREAVREDRTPGGKHRHKRPRYEEGGVTVFDPAQDKEDDLLIAEILLAKADSVPEPATKLPDGTFAPPPATAGIMPPGNSGSGDSCYNVNELMQYGYLELKYIITWAKRVPGFLNLALDDQMALLKSSFMELNVLRLSYRSTDTPGKVKFATNVILSSADSAEIGWGKDLIDATLDFVARLKDVFMDRTEFNIINTIVLLYPDAHGIKDRPKVMALQTKMLNSLRRYTSKTYPNEPRRYGKLLLRLPALRTVSAKAMDKFLSLTLTGDIKMNALVLEMMN